MSRPSRARQTVTYVVAFAGWVLFGFWWHRVALQSTPSSAEAAAFALVVMAVITFFFTLIWIRHNMRLARNGKRGKTALYLEPDFQVDSLNRALVFDEAGGVREDAWFVLDADEREKRYTYGRHVEQPALRGGQHHG